MACQQGVILIVQRHLAAEIEILVGFGFPVLTPAGSFF